jgi:uncharacterized small protein (DUF1192 family)
MNPAVKQLAVALMKKRLGNGQPSKARRKAQKAARKAARAQANSGNVPSEPM